ncbi:uncharacterized protein LOC131018306 [Salvia miltiorrhiza]|uniref:uncharacterized protein LOC131018306 n=1 Tax=Salvia miltiorrhiza TaxID=226208 RepID=UPI0025AC4BAF|nr:uncharacterized protein LOC131018306 [Salvia miltiorrhiza]
MAASPATVPPAISPPALTALSLAPSSEAEPSSHQTETEPSILKSFAQNTTMEEQPQDVVTAATPSATPITTVAATPVATSTAISETLVPVTTAPPEILVSSTARSTEASAAATNLERVFYPDPQNVILPVTVHFASPANSSMPTKVAPNPKKRSQKNVEQPKPRKISTRRSDRIIQQPRKSGPKSPIHIDLEDEEETSGDESNAQGDDEATGQSFEGKKLSDLPLSDAHQTQSSKAAVVDEESDEYHAFSDFDLKMEKALTTELYDVAAATRRKTIQGAVCYTERIVDEKTIQYVYANMHISFGDPLSNKFGKIFVYNKVYNLSPSVINEVFEFPEVQGENVKDLDAVARVITGGNQHTWTPPMKVSSLTHLYSVLHKVMTVNWIVSSNSTVVTQQHGILLYCIGLNKPFNLGQTIFDQIASCSDKSQLAFLHFPSLIYTVLKN